MRSVRFLSWTFTLAALFFSFCGCSDSSSPKTRLVGKERSDSIRIVSTAPSITETLIDLGFGESIVAVSDYCKNPEEIGDLPRIGSLRDFNVEAIVELDPDFVVVLKENDLLPRSLEKFGVETVVVDHSSLEGVLASIKGLAGLASRRVDSPSNAKEQKTAFDRGQKLLDDFRERIEAVRSSVSDLPKPRVLISLYRTTGTKSLGEVYVAGQNPYFNEILEIVGAKNCADSLLGAAPIINVEGAIRLNPEAIVDLSTDGIKREGDELNAQIVARRAEWETLGKDVDAVKEGRIYPILDDFATVPSSRSILFIEKLADILHPDRNLKRS